VTRVHELDRRNAELLLAEVLLEQAPELQAPSASNITGTGTARRRIANTSSARRCIMLDISMRQLLKAIFRQRALVARFGARDETADRFRWR
jgi:hypothetical protein